jgi:3',5'-cyclic AMP phosphodiesterase CpdA
MTNAKGNDLMNRRRFLNLSGWMLAVAGLCCAWITAGAAQSSLSPELSLKVALLSDTHIPTDLSWQPAANQKPPAEHLKEVARQIAESGCDFSLVCGDLARVAGEPGDYKNWQMLMAPVFAKMPVYVAMGNHDVLTNYYQVFGEPEEKATSIKNKHVLAFEKAGLRFVVLDSHVGPPAVPGLLGKIQRQWLERYLESEDPRPVFVFLHHALSDDDTDLLDTDRLLNILLSKRQVKAVFYGHSHCFSHTQIEDLNVVNLPATGYSFSTNQPIGWVEGRFTARGAVLLMHAVDGDKTLNGQPIPLTWR